VIQFALENIPPFKNDEILMLGDREFDIDGGKFYQLKTAWAKWGYGVEEVLIKSEPDVILNAPLELLSII
jgi:phosphoglycolate phosphatase-like HAD superfamily hydrolase